jgi:hypothetical protein
MNWFEKLPGHRRSPPGLERSILHLLPRALAAGTLIPVFAYLYARYFPSPAEGQTVERYLSDIGILAISVIATVWTAVLTIAIGCFVVMVMKGPAYVADRYPLQDADEPAQHRPGDDADAD